MSTSKNWSGRRFSLSLWISSATSPSPQFTKTDKRLKRILEELCCDWQLTRVVLQPVHHLTHVPHHHTWLRHRRLPDHKNVLILEMPKEKKRTDDDPGNWKSLSLCLNSSNLFKLVSTESDLVQATNWLTVLPKRDSGWLAKSNRYCFSSWGEDL